MQRGLLPSLCTDRKRTAMNLQEHINGTQPLDRAAMERAQKRLDSIAKPLNSLGLLETNLVKIAGITGNAAPSVKNKYVVVMCADNGVVAEGVTQTSSEVTAVVTENFAKGFTTVGAMSRIAGATLLPVDIGVARDLTEVGVLNRKIAYGTKNMTKEPAMTREQAIQAIETGIAIVAQLKKQDCNLIATGEMGIGNTTTSSAIAAVLLEQPVELVTGRGAGLCSEGLKRKIQAIHTAIDLNKPNKDDALDVLAKVGGFDVAGLVGVFLGGAYYHIPVVMDGFISSVAALAAVKLCPLVSEYLVPSHISKEPAGQLIMDALALEPMITAQMCLGEGTGAVTLFPILDMIFEVYHTMSTFDEIHIDEYVPLD